jgi:ABC-type transporter MlaC component/outer membrane lipoprotein SlyB
VISVLKQDVAAGKRTDMPGLIEKKILPLFDFPRMTSIAVARNWPLASPAQQEALIAEFRALLVHTYSTALADYRHQEIEYRPLRAAPGETEVLVRSFLRRRGLEPLTIDYDMQSTTAGWKVFDVKIAGVSLVLNYRETFAATVRSDGIDGLIKVLSDKNRQNAAGAKGADGPRAHADRRARKRAARKPTSQADSRRCSGAARRCAASRCTTRWCCRSSPSCASIPRAGSPRRSSSIARSWRPSPSSWTNSRRRASCCAGGLLPGYCTNPGRNAQHRTEPLRPAGRRWTMHTKLFAGLLALALLAGAAQAQTSVAAAPRIEGFDVEPLAQLAAGNELAFTLYGTPGGIANVRVGGATAALILAESEAGVYEGTYTIGRRDRITPESTATGTLRVGNRVASSVLDDSLLVGAAPRWPGDLKTVAALRIDRFEVDPPSRLAAGEELLFSLSGTPGAIASVRIDGVRGKLGLEEVRPGSYEGAYTIKNRDRLAANTVVTGNVRLGKQERSTVLGQSLVEAAPSAQRRSNRRVAAPAAAPVCANCGVVEAINVVEHKGDGSYVGMIAGGIAGALLGNQVGDGSGRRIATVVGAAGGGFAGNEIEKRMKTTRHYEVVVRLESGGTQMVSYPAEPTLKVGNRVRVENGAFVQI